MEAALIAAPIILALGIANVWIVRAASPTAYRGGDAQNLKEEFESYGLPGGFMRLIGAAKLLLAAALVVGIWVPQIVQPAAIGMAVLMVGAITMHVKVKDPPLKALPAMAMLALSVFVAAFN